MKELCRKVRQDYLLLDIMKIKSGANIWLDIYNKPTSSKRYVPFMSNNPWHFLTNIAFSLTRRMYTNVQNEKVKEKCFKKLRKHW